MNRVMGTLIQYYSKDAVSKAVVLVGDTIVTAVIMVSLSNNSRLVAGSRVSVVFKESETAIAYLLPSGVISIRNRLPCTVIAVDDDCILASVTMDFLGNRIESLITSESASELCLRPGKSVFALIKSTEVMIEKSDP